MPRALSRLLGLALLLGAPPAFADENQEDRPPPPPPPSRPAPALSDGGPDLGLDVALGLAYPSFGEELDVRVFVPDLHLGLSLFEDVYADVDWGFVVTRLSDPDGMASETTTKVGNPTLAMHLGLDGRRYGLRIGAAITAPVAGLDDEDNTVALQEILGYGVASSMRGGWDSWRWLPDTLTFSFPIRFAYALWHDLTLALDLEPSVLVVTGDDGRVESIVQTAADLRYDLDPLVVGVRTQAVFFATFDVADKAQVSLVPYLDYRFGGTTLGVELAMNLDGPNGFAFDEGGVWGLWFVLGFGF